jgi:hypothetical protein
MNTERLLKLADLLEADAENEKGIKFDLGMWGESTEQEPSQSCGTTACAMGLAAISGVFAHAGLACNWDYLGHVNGAPLRTMKITFNGRIGGVSAGASLFEISHEQSAWLFMPMNYGHGTPIQGAPGERAVANRIRDFVAGTARTEGAS